MTTSARIRSGVSSADLFEGPLSVGYTDEVVFAVGERQLDDLLDREAVVGQEDLLWPLG